MNKVILAGSRDIDDYELLCNTIIESGFQIHQVICGMAKGVDLLGYRWAKENSIPIKECYPNWKQFGRSAGILRNEDMLELATHLIAIRKNYSAGTSHMIKIAKAKGIEVFVKDIE